MFEKEIGGKKVSGNSLEKIYSVLQKTLDTVFVMYFQS